MDNAFRHRHGAAAKSLCCGDHGTNFRQSCDTRPRRTQKSKWAWSPIARRAGGKTSIPANLQGYFDVLGGGDTLATRKPEPETVQAMTKLGGTPQDTVLLGDSEADTGAARGRVKCVCVSFGYRRVPLRNWAPMPLLTIIRTA